MQRYCEIGDCERLAFRNGKCSAHVKQLQRTGKTVPIAEKLTPEARALEAGNAWLQAGDSDEEYETRRRAFILACKALGRKEMRDAIREAMAAARQSGTRLGRPPKVGSQKIREMLAQLKSVTAVARALGLHRDTIYKHLARCRRKKLFSTPQIRPRLAG